MGCHGLTYLRVRVDSPGAEKEKGERRKEKSDAEVKIQGKQRSLTGSCVLENTFTASTNQLRNRSVELGINKLKETRLVVDLPNTKGMSQHETSQS